MSDMAAHASVPIHLRSMISSVRMRCARKDVARIAKERNLHIPSLARLKRRLDADIPREVRIYKRCGQKAFEASFPSQERDRSAFRAIEALCADGHKFDLTCLWPDGTKRGRASYSGSICFRACRWRGELTAQ